ncbi:alpha/beta hydrolase [candidate division KSB1 bacterium]|nr:alpha/beta hydrolase [candidate division KSB1 bacterium]
MKSLIVFIFFFLMGISNTIGQTISTSIPKKVKKSEKYLFYLHGGIIQAQGIDAISPYWGRYEYTSILDTLSSYGFNVISEARPKDTDESEYADKIAKEIDTLLNSGVAPEDIIVVGASAGGSITIDISIRVKNGKIKYAVLGVCRWASWKAYLNENELCGNFLSIYESSDTYGSCESYFKDQPCKSDYKEIKLNMGNGHGFIFRPYQEWVHPLVKWINGG